LIELRYHRQLGLFEKDRWIIWPMGDACN